MKNLFVQSILFSILFLAAQFKQSFSLTVEQRELIDQYIEIYMRDNFIPGLGLSIVENNGLNILSIGYGASRLETNTPATSQTVFAVGSISKGITGVLVSKVLNEKFPELGESALETPIVNLAPNFNVTFSDRFRAESMTFRDLLSHRSCLYNDGLDLLFGSSLTEEELIYRARYQRESCSFRTSFVYNNNNYALASNLIAHIAERSFTELTNDFFNQLGMRSTRLASSDGNHEELPNMSHAYFRKNNETFQFNMTHLRRAGVLSGGGGVLSTATDMGQYIRFHLNKGRVGNIQVVPEEVLNWVYKIAIGLSDTSSVPLGSSGVYGYGLGFILGVYQGNTWINHGGFWPPYETALSLYPEIGFGTFITNNGPGMTGTYPGQISQQLLQLIIFDIVHGNLTNLADIDYYNKYNIISKQMTLDTLTTLSNQNIRSGGQLHKFQVGKKLERVEPEDVVGVYGSSPDGDVLIAIESDDSLSINFGSYALGTLIRVNETTFSIQWITNIEDDFYSYGNIDGIRLFELDFSTQDQFVLKTSDSIVISYSKNGIIDMAPPIPWDPESCGPSA